MVEVADCERVQANWFRFRAESLDGDVRTDGPLTWTNGPDGLNLMFPRELPRDAVGRGVERAGSLGVPIVGAWLSNDVDPSALAEAGFERGWEPWWMAAELRPAGLADPPARPSTAELQLDSDDYSGEYAPYRRTLAAARRVPTRAWYAAAYAEPRRFAGRAWSFLDDGVAAEPWDGGNTPADGSPAREPTAGIFDMAVLPQFRRRGHGSDLLAAVCAAAAGAGARHAVLNATPEGERLYSRRGFARVGTGITYWLHLR